MAHRIARMRDALEQADATLRWQKPDWPGDLRCRAFQVSFSRQVQ
jgi:hypothetical protein